MTIAPAVDATQARESEHTFHIPVMGTGFSIDTPLWVAPYGISSVISLVDDVLIEQVRKYHATREGLPFTAITNEHPDPRAARITAYLDLLDDLVTQRSDTLRASPFEPGSPITQYFEMLPETDLKHRYRTMLRTTDPTERAALEKELRTQAVPGRIDRNIMTKLNRVRLKDGEPLPDIFSDAMSALRGFANSKISAAIVFSAGLNAKLYTYASEFEDFHLDKNGNLKKEIILKVSDFRSSTIQGRFLAKRGLWVSEFRVESGLNCGGHAFATPGYLLGPILEEFKKSRSELIETLHAAYMDGCKSHDLPQCERPYPMRITAQGGIGTAGEHSFFLKYYNVDGAGWGTPFLLVPDVTHVDEEHLTKLLECTATDVELSPCSPMGIPFWCLRTSSSEEARKQHIADGTPGAPCPKGYLRLNTEFSKEPICPASREYLRQKLAQFDTQPQDDPQVSYDREMALQKTCVCHELGGGVSRRYDLNPNAKTSICCGPNIIYFKRLAKLEEMVGHIYGRLSLLCTTERPHMFIQELRLYVEHLCEEVEKYSSGLISKTPKQMEEIGHNLQDGVRYYRMLAKRIVGEKTDKFLTELTALQKQIEAALLPVRNEPTS